MTARTLSVNGIAALTYARRGWRVLPIYEMGPDGHCACYLGSQCPPKQRGKHPRLDHGVSDATDAPDQVEDWWARWPDANIAIATCASTAVIDIDPRSGGVETFARLVAELGPIGPTLTCRTGSGGWHYYCSAPVRNSSGSIAAGGLQTGSAPGVDVRGEGGYVLAPPSNHVSGGVYAWDGPGPGDIGHAVLTPPWIAAMLPRPVVDRPRGLPAYRTTPESREQALRFLRDAAPAIKGQSGDTVVMSVMATLRTMGVTSEDDAVDLCVESGWDARCQPSWNSGGVPRLQRKYRESKVPIGAPARARRQAPQPSAQAVLDEAREPPHTEDDRPRAKSVPVAAREDIAEGTFPADHTDTKLSERFAARFGPTLRFVAEQGRWRKYASGVWAVEPETLIFGAAKAICTEASGLVKFNTGGQALAKTLESSSTRASVVKLAKGETKIHAGLDLWDQEPFALNTPDGVVDLPSGEIRPSRADDFMTRQTSIGPADHDDCPRWHAFIDSVSANSIDFKIGLRSVCFYMLTGDTSAQKFFFLYGDGGRGKGVFLHTISFIMGSYAQTASSETFTKSAFPKHLTELAALDGPRLVTASEVQKGAAWNEERLKQITGGDTIRANFMRQDGFDFRPVCKLAMSGNHKPTLSSVDEAMRRRVVLIPFDQPVPKKDPTLETALRVEATQILRWMLGGNQSLTIPPSWQTATDAYFASEDIVGEFIEDCTVIGDVNVNADQVPIAELYKRFVSFCESKGERPLKRNDLIEQMLHRGSYERGRTDKDRTLKGLRLVYVKPPVDRRSGEREED